MIDVAVIASLPHLGDIAALGSIDMALTHLVHSHPGYATHYRSRADAGVPVYLDNGAFELDRVLEADAVLSAAQMVQASVVVCTDVPFDADATVTATRRFLAHADRHGVGPDSRRYRFMAVPQGTSRAEWLACHDTLAALPGIALIGLSKLSVPRCFAAPIAEARLDCVAALARRHAPHPLHLLGGDRSLPWELTQHRARGHHHVVSNDSSFAYWYAATGVPLDPATGRAAAEAPTPPELLTTTLTPRQFTAAHASVAALRRAASLTLSALPPA